MDSLTPAQRSERMSRVKSKDTKPEVRVRRLVHGLGYRYRLHGRKLPGCPDLVFAGRRKVIFVHGCFWHRHPGCGNTRLPKSKLGFWKSKLEENRRRDLRNQRLLRQIGWEFLVVWECETRDLEQLTKKIVEFLEE
ncbi:MAG: very short patch repair endonuclease [bacterium]